MGAVVWQWIVTFKEAVPSLGVRSLKEKTCTIYKWYQLTISHLGIGSIQSTDDHNAFIDSVGNTF